MAKRICIRTAVAVVVVIAVLAQAGRQELVVAQSPAQALPVFEVDAGFPQLPEKMMIGGVGGVAADRSGSVWAIHRMVQPWRITPLEIRGVPWVRNPRPRQRRPTPRQR
jgi:hypothetical protein